MRRMGPICSSPNRRPPSLAWVCRRMPGRLMPRGSGDLRNGASCWGPGLVVAGAVSYAMDKLLGLLIEHRDDKRSVAALEIVWEVFSKPVGGAGDDGVVDGTVQMRARVQRTKDMSAQPDKDKKP